MSIPAQQAARSAVVAGAALTRLVFVAWFLARPDDPARVLGHPPSARWRGVARAVAVREAVLGGGTLRALRAGRPTQAWVRAMAAADTLDGTMIATVGARGSSAPRRVVLSAATALGGTASELVLARALGRTRQ